MVKHVKKKVADSAKAREITIPLLSSNASSESDEVDVIVFTYSRNLSVSTRYTYLNFFPKCFFEQFRRLANVYFLCIGIIAVFGTYTSKFDSAVEPLGMLIPLFIVVLISVMKDGVEGV
jgi:hypothetical protein